MFSLNFLRCFGFQYVEIGNDEMSVVHNDSSMTSNFTMVQNRTITRLQTTSLRINQVNTLSPMF